MKDLFFYEGGEERFKFNIFIKDLIKGKKKIDSGKKFLNNLNTWTLYGEDDLVGFISGVKSVPSLLYLVKSCPFFF